MLLPSAPTVTFSEISASEYSQARKAATTAKPATTYPLKKTGSTLTVPTTQGLQVFRDLVIRETQVKQGHSEDEQITYTYMGYLTSFQRHVVKVTRYETSEWWLIAKNGRRLTLWGAPLYAPDQKQVVAICPGLEYSGGQPNIVQLFQMKDGVLQKVWETQPTTWEPEEIFWTSSTVLYLKRESYSDHTPISYWKLTIM
ncbi:hypothetical protein [Hymenobacter volaticus]|uniref:Uncharacterized protein n=1 Tax=Hymenobacter volaticus TaxID=2932254 RepID=A0ABY4G2S9_9BACT|nr:hypothetical protein [Hymenobacter volaticus]UOQ65175.1 hypothetical protein MUN86_16655 [Hymenobacter volaticus]